MIRCVVFDFDGTLVDSNAIKFSSFLDVAGELPGGVEVMAGVINSQTSATRYEIFDCFVADMQIPQSQRAALSCEMAAKYTALCYSEISKATEITGIQVALGRLAVQGLRLYVSSATPTEPLRALIRARGWHRIFHGVYGSPASKETHVRQIISEGRWAPEELVYVGDSDADALAAAETGCGFIGVCLDGKQGRFSKQPEQHVATMEMLPDLIAGYASRGLNAER